MKRKRKSKSQRFKTLLTSRKFKVVSALVLVFLVALPVYTYFHFARDIANRERLMNRSSTGIVLRDKNGEVFYQYGHINGNDDIKLSEVSDIFEKTVVVSEDEDFYQHDGLSIKGMFGAFIANILNKDLTRYGGSTITQQLVKNKLLSGEKSFLRKYQEIVLATEIDRKYTKDQILEMYINSVYFGEGAFGIADASKAYFNKKPQDLNLAESSMLVGLLPAPSLYSPISGNKMLAKTQQERVLDKMIEEGKINNSAKKAALAQELTYNPAPLDKQKHAQHFALMIIEDLKHKYGEEKVIRSGFDVTTTLDLKWQAEAEDIIKERVAALSSAGGRNAMLIAIDPKNGQVRSLVGSADWENKTFGKLNMAFQSRQPGSSFKPIFYAEALDQHLITAATVIKDEPKVYGSDYRPTNYDLKYRGEVTVRSSLAQSLNIPSVEIMQKLGTQDASDAAQRMGLSTVNEPDKYGLSLALGTAEVKPYEITNAYAAFANQGEQFTPSLYTRIVDKYETEVFEADKPIAKRVISKEAAYLISSILSDNKARAPIFGSSLTINGRQVAVKTGTTNDNKDAWTMGYTPNLTVGVWVGNNENEPMTGVVGSNSAGAIWRKAMTSWVADLPREDFVSPDDITTMQVCVPGGTAEELFIKGTEPKDSCKKKEEEEKRKTEEEEEEKKEEQKVEETKPSDNSGPSDGTTSDTDNVTEEGGRGGGAGETSTEPTPTPEPEPQPVTQESTSTPTDGST
jgi:1A family penicillin-binding protein